MKEDFVSKSLNKECLELLRDLANELECGIGKMWFEHDLSLISEVRELIKKLETATSHLNLLKCFCGNTPDVDSYEPCDDYPGSLYENWDSNVRCGYCRASSEELPKRYSTKEESEANAILLWNKFITKNNSPSLPEISLRTRGSKL
jgi:hypothetical protein